MLRVVTALVALAGAAVFMATPVQADDTSTTFTLTAAGGLGISVPGTTDLGAVATDAGTISAQLGSVTVTDERGALLGSWTASVVGSDFTTGEGTADETIAKANVSYWSGAATASSGTAVLVPGQLTSLLAVPIDTAKTAFSASGVVGNNSASFNPTVVVTIPSDAVVGEYSGTVTHSVA